MDLTTIPRHFNTKKIGLRPLVMTDAKGMFDILSDVESMKYWSDQPINHIDEAKDTLDKDLQSDAKGKSMCWAITLAGQDQLIGKCILFNFDPLYLRAEIGYVLNRRYWRQGLMRHALNAVIEFAFKTLELHRIEADVDAENLGSLALLEGLGFEREGLFRDRWCVYGEWQDSVMLALLNPD